MMMCQVKDLISWADGDNSLLSQDIAASSTDGYMTLSTVTVNNYFNLVCQVWLYCSDDVCEAHSSRVLAMG